MPLDPNLGEFHLTSALQRLVQAFENRHGRLHIPPRGTRFAAGANTLGKLAQLCRERGNSIPRKLHISSVYGESILRDQHRPL